jgi:hypothetical protein
MRMTAIQAQTQQKRLDRAVYRAGKRGRRTGMMRVRRPIRPTPGAFATSGNAQGEKRLFNWRNQAILTSDGRPLGGCRFKPLVSRHCAGKLKMPAITQRFISSLSDRLCASRIEGPQIGSHLTAVNLQDGDVLEIDPGTLIVDAMGAGSLLMKLISSRPGAPAVEEYPSNIGYMTQIFRLRSRFGSSLLPDPVADCANHLGHAFVTLYVGAGGWFTVTLAWDIRRRSTSDMLSDTPSVVNFASRSPGVARWIAAAEPVGPSRRYMNPVNRWSVPVIASEDCPANYVAIGDALTTTAPTLGAGCSWLASHVRILAEAVETGKWWRQRFAQKVTEEQRGFFDLSVSNGAPVTLESPPELPHRNGPLRVLLSPIIDRKRHAVIRDHVMMNSTL